MHYLKLKYLLVLLISGFSQNTLSDGRDIFNEASQGVVYISTDKGTASGVIISNRGHIITNWHAINKADPGSIQAILHYSYNFKEFEDHLFNIEIIKVDEISDLALIKIINPPEYLKVIKISKVIPAVGSEAHAIGHPHGEVWTYTKGYISQHRDDYEWRYEDNDLQHEANVYQIQTPISEGSSGGPLLNEFGNLIGINTFGSKDAESLNFAVDVSQLIKFLASN